MDEHLLVPPAQVQHVPRFERAHGGLMHAADDEVSQRHPLQVGGFSEQRLLLSGDARFQALVGGFNSRGIRTWHDVVIVRQIAGCGQEGAVAAPPPS